MSKNDDSQREGTAPIQLKLRFLERTRAKLAAAADSNAASLNSEIVTRLERSLEEDDLKGGPENARFFASLSTEIERAEAMTGKPWRDDLATYRLVELLIADALGRGRPRLPQHPFLIEIAQEEAQVRTQRDLKLKLLTELGVVGQMNALARFLPGSPGFVVMPQEQWRDPEGNAVTDEADIAVLKRLVDDLEALEAKLKELDIALKAGLKPYQEAKLQADAIYSSMKQVHGEQ